MIKLQPTYLSDRQVLSRHLQKQQSSLKRTHFSQGCLYPQWKAQNKDCRIKGHMKRKSWGIGSDKWETQRQRNEMSSSSKHIRNSKISQDSSSSTNEMAELMRGKVKKSTKTSSHAFCICGNNVEITRKLFAISIWFENVNQILLQKQFHNNDFSHGGDKTKLDRKFNTESISLVLFQLASLLPGCLLLFFNSFLYFVCSRHLLCLAYILGPKLLYLLFCDWYLQDSRC